MNGPGTRRRPWRLEHYDQATKTWRTLTTFHYELGAENRRDELVNHGVRPDDLRIEKHVEFEATS